MQAEAETLNIFENEYSVGDYMFHSWQIIKHNWKNVILIVFIFSLPVNIITAYLDSKVSYEFQPSTGDLILSIISFLLSFFSILIPVTIAFLVDSYLMDKDISLDKLLTHGLHKFFKSVGLTILQVIYLMGLYLLLIIPGIIFSVYWTFSIFALSLRNETGQAAMDYSKMVVVKKWWRVFFVLLIIQLLSFVVTIPVYISFQISGSDFLLLLILNSLLSVIEGFFIIPKVLLFINTEAIKLQEIEKLING